MPLLSVIIPVYNERELIRKVIARVEKALLPASFEREIIIVNDGSTDGTGEVLLSLEQKYQILHQKNTGKGGAVRAGFKLAKGDYIIVQDADLEQDPNDFQALLAPVMQGKADVAFGSRFLGKYLPQALTMNLHYLLNRFFTITCNLLSGYRTSDMWTGYKMYSRKALDAILPLFKSNGIEFEPEITILLSKLGFKIMDVPISYTPRWYAEGKKTNWKQAARSYVKMLGFVFRTIKY
ncbi:MAG: glycosyltransferase family 2 protein [Candidatus Doudnabacteria bacterium]|nr:glycosyltransferase family 2 protein [Candidatus Doudnabacteria bacterium]